MYPQRVTIVKCTPEILRQAFAEQIEINARSGIIGKMALYFMAQRSVGSSKVEIKSIRKSNVDALLDIWAYDRHTIYPTKTDWNTPVYARFMFIEQLTQLNEEQQQYYQIAEEELHD